jgi:hypothetical protein
MHKTSMGAFSFAHKPVACVQDFAILDYRANMRLDNLPVAEIAKFAYDDQVGAAHARCCALPGEYVGDAFRSSRRRSPTHKCLL